MLRAFLIGAAVAIALLPGSVRAEDAADKFSLEDAEQKWFGSIETGGPKLRLLIEVKRQEDGAFAATAFSLDQGNAAIPVETFNLDGGKLTMDVPAVKGSYAGTLSEDGRSVEGKWTQSGRDMTLNLQRVAAAPSLKTKAAWKGTLVAGAVKLEVQFRIVDGVDGQEEVFFDSLTQMQKGFGASMQETENGVIFEVPAVRGQFEGTYNDDQTVLDGTWSQAGNELELKLEKQDEADEQAAARPRPQHPKEPLPYESEEVTFLNEAAGITLAGTLTTPESGGPFPAVVLVSGSGPQDRDETIMEHKPFLVIADHLTREGIAVLRFDDRGVGKSEGDFLEATSADFATDASAAIEFLKGDSRCDPNVWASWDTVKEVSSPECWRRSVMIWRTSCCWQAPAFQETKS